MGEGKKNIMNSIEVLLNEMWKDYISYTPSAEKISKLFGEQVTNDHIAFRTLNLDQCNIFKQADYLKEFGYKVSGDYHFEQKKLNAIHLENTEERLPKIFLSELILEDFSHELKNCFVNLLSKVELNAKDLFIGGRSWELDYALYTKLAKESEYASWLYVWGFCPNHFTVSINHLTKFHDITDVNAMVKANGFTLNSSGGEIKGTKEELLEQSSIMADKIKVRFGSINETVPSCYYEFAKRYSDSSGKIFQGFVTISADKIFESTNK
tara:strand:- start:1682 stop:2482 length:801 start_codon:yes stop_codon:yes gene_type:complete